MNTAFSSRHTLALLGIVFTATALWADPICQVRDIFPPQPKHVHGSSIVECPDGSFLACWFHGSGERTADDVLIQGARWRPGDAAWSPVFPMADTPGFPDCNPVLFVDAHERLWMFWIAVLAHRWECSLLKYRRAEICEEAGPPQWSWQDVISLDPGERFATDMKKAFDSMGLEEGMWAEYALPYTELLVEAAQDPIKREIGWMTRIHPLVLPSGRILLPLYSDGFNACLAAISDDVGETWRASGVLTGLGPIQPTFVRKKDGTVVAYLRDSGNAPNRVLQSTSKDDGESWSPAVDTEIPNPGSSLEVISLQDGAWIMAFNDTEDSRERLAVAVSEDEGATWPRKRILEPRDGEQGSYAYPSLIQSRDGLIHLTYSASAKTGKTIRHAVFNAEWGRQAPR